MGKREFPPLPTRPQLVAVYPALLTSNLANHDRKTNLRLSRRIGFFGGMKTEKIEAPEEERGRRPLEARIVMEEAKISLD